MRVGISHVAIVVLVAIIAMAVVCTMSAEGKRYILTDGFNGPDGSSPDVNKWVVDESDANDNVFVSQGELVTYVSDGGHAYCEMARDFSNDNISMTVRFNPGLLIGRSFELTLMTEDNTSSIEMLIIKYDAAGWGYTRQWQGKTESYSSGNATLFHDWWYNVELNLTNGSADFQVWVMPGDPIWTLDDLPIDPMLLRNKVYFGVDTVGPWGTIRTLWENFTLVDPWAEPNIHPKWMSLPSEFEATEDVVYTFAFVRFIEDDQELWELTLSSASPYVIDIDGFLVSFLFPNNVSRAYVQLVVGDGYAETGILLNFRVIAVNDPPSHNIPLVMSAIEGMEVIIPVWKWVEDMDDPKSSLFLTTDSPYAEVDGLEVVVVFPDGLRQYTLEIRIHDGKANTSASIYFTITPVDSPPQISPIPSVDIVEDTELTLDLADYITDRDTPDSLLHVTVFSIHCTVDGLLLHILYPDGGFTDDITVQVSDGTNWVERNFTVRVGGIDDPPHIQDIPTIFATEGESKQVRIFDYVYDEETPNGYLVLACDDPNVLQVRGLNLTLLFDEWTEDHQVNFTVSDGDHTSTGSFIVTVQGVNDEPMITKVGNLDPPYYIYVMVGSHRWLDLEARDPDDTSIRYEIESIWTGFRVLDSTLIVSAYRDDMGDHTANLVARDPRGGVHRVVVIARVVDRDSIPVELSVLNPSNHSTFNEGDTVVLDFTLRDPQGVLSPPVFVSWSINEGDPIASFEWPPTSEVIVEDFPEGTHQVFIWVSDGNFTLSEWIVVQVGEARDTTSVNTWAYLCIGFIVLIIIIIMAMLISRATGKLAQPQKFEKQEVQEAREMAYRDTEERQYMAKMREDGQREARIHAAQKQEEQRKATKDDVFLGTRDRIAAKAQRDAGSWSIKTRPSPPTQAATHMPGSLPTEDELQVQIGTIRGALEALSGGLPPELDLFDEPMIAKRIVKGRKKWSPDGSLLAFVQGAWYYVDPSDPRFMDKFLD